MCIEAALGSAIPIWPHAAPFDLVFANILKGPLIELAPAYGRPYGPARRHAILSGILNPQAESVIAAYAAEGLHCTRRAELGEWTTLTISP
jgi:ribosomal protein L11 methyltransferase